MHRDTSHQAAHRFFSGITEYAFYTQLGVTDPPLVDYISAMLTRFVHNNEVLRLRKPTGQRLNQVVDMLAEAQAREGTAKREVHRHIGDYTLFWTGLYPEALERIRKANMKDSLIDYPTQGKRAYHIASTIPTEKKDARSDVLERLSHLFELCAYGLGEVRREWERRDDQGLTPLWIN